MKKNLAIVAVAGVIVALVVAMWALGGVRSGGDAKGPVDRGPTSSKSGRTTTTFAADPGSDALAPGPPDEAAVPDPAVDDERRPTSPAEEGLFALADASGRGIVRCDLSGHDVPADVLHIFRRDAVQEGDVLTMMIAASDEPGVDQRMGTSAEGTMVELVYRDAFVGSMGTCQVETREVEEQAMDVRRASEVDPAMIARILENARTQAQAKVDDADEKIDPIQVALDTPGLSAEATAWLEDRLDAKVGGASRMLDAIDEVDAAEDELLAEEDPAP